jgi:hypothetical protein
VKCFVRVVQGNTFCVSSSEVFRVKCSSEVICMRDPEKLALTSPTSGGRSVSIVSSRTQATDLVS